MFKGILPFVNILFFMLVANIYFVQAEELPAIFKPEIESDKSNSENTLFAIEMENTCNYENSGQRFNNEINSIAKCVNLDFDNETRNMKTQENIMETKNIENTSDDRSLISLRNREFENEEDYTDSLEECSYYNIYPNYDEICLPENEF